MEITGTSKKLISIAKSKYGLQCVGNGVAAPGVIKKFILEFDCLYSIDQAGARKLVIDYTEDCVVQLNANDKSKLHLENLPANEKHIYFMIVFKDHNKKICSELSAVILSNSKIMYSKYDPITNNFCDYYEENYHDAYLKVYTTIPPERY